MSTERADLVLIRPNSKNIMYHGVKAGATAVDPPYWLAVMGGYIRDMGIDVALIDAEAAGMTHEETAQAVSEMAPALVGVLTIGSNLTASTWTMPGAGLVCKAIKDATAQTPIFLWGNHPSALPERSLREEAIDYVILGEGFDTVVELLHHCKNGVPALESIGGIHYLKDGHLCGDGRVRVITDLDRLPVDGWDLFPENQRHYRNHMHFAFEDLSKRNRYGAILSSLGCPYNCAYCAIRTFSGNTRTLRYRSLETAIAEVDYWVKERNVYYLRIMDECFTINRDFAMAFSKLLIERNYGLSIWINARIDTVDEEFLYTMRAAGIKWLGYGIESGNQHIRGIVNKQQYDMEKTKNTVELTQSSGMYICGNLMFGLPGEKAGDMEADLAMLREFNVEYPNMYCTMAYPGSQLYADTLREYPDWLPDNWAGYAQLSYETQPLPTEYLTSQEILAFRDQAFNRFFENNPCYFNMIEAKFGQPAVDAINNMLKGKLQRKILGD